jgi:hypothetical protein
MDGARRLFDERVSPMPRALRARERVRRLAA